MLAFNKAFFRGVNYLIRILGLFKVGVKGFRSKPIKGLELF
ncbi:hypothetical protein HPCPY6261_1609 [Helicobacter pylori CPY6261]|nr:hypothetical protein HPCPY6261_1609 [Helicobacter pylori CPY6261]